MKIGVIGAGNVGGTLGTRWAKGGNQVVFGVRAPQSEQSKRLGPAEVRRHTGVVYRASRPGL